MKGVWPMPSKYSEGVYRIQYSVIKEAESTTACLHSPIPVKCPTDCSTA